MNIRRCEMTLEEAEALVALRRENIEVIVYDTPHSTVTVYFPSVTIQYNTGDNTAKAWIVDSGRL
jgi:hypothetical protein